MKKFLLLLPLLLFSIPASASIDAYQFDSPEMEANYNQLINELRCLVCQNQNLSGSDADLAKDLRRETYEMLKQGKSPDQVIEFMVARYGDFVLYRPQFKSSTYLLWLGPFFLLVLVLIWFIRRFKGRTVVVTADRQAMEQARQLLEKDETKS
ncbi:MAG: cytochrome c-type biogenesis protein [Pseudomonadota bacterium]